MIHFKDTKNKSALSTRWLQMTKQEQIIEKKKMEIQAKLEAQKQAAALAAQAKLTNPATNEESGSSNIFSNDGSFMSQYKALLEKQNKEKQVKEANEKQEQEGIKKNKSEHKEKSDTSLKKEEHDSDEAYHHNERRPERGSRDRHRRWNDRGRHRQHSPTTPIVEDRKKNLDTLNIPPLMQLSVRPPDDHSPPSSHTSRWESHDGPLNDDYDHDDYDHDDYDPDDQDDNSQDNPNSDSSMGQSSMNFVPMGCGPGLMGPGSMGPGPMGGGPMGAGPMGPGPMGPMGPGPNMPPGPCPPSSGPMMGPGPMPPMPPPFMNPNFPMPPNFIGPNGLCGPMPPMCGPNMRGPRPNGPMPPFFPPFSNQMPGPNGPSNAMMTANPGTPPTHSPFRANSPNFCPPPFGPNGPNFGPNGPNPPFMGPNKKSDCKSLDIPPPEPMKLQNIPPPMPMPLNHIPKPKDMEPCNIPAPPIPNQVLSPDVASAVRRAAVEITANGDQWEQALKIQDNMWFLRNTNSNEYKAYRELVNQMRREKQPEIKPEDKYEPEFSLEDDDSNDNSKPIKEEMNDSYNIYTNQSNIKREHTSSQSDEDEKRERRRRKKSRWGDTSDVKPGTVATLPNVMPGASLAKIDEAGLKLTNVNRNNHALMQYAMTNYGTTNLSVDDWKKCENNFKLNLLYQDMLKKRQEVERLAAAGKHKYEYDSDEDTSDGTWEHRLRAKEMNATERWATELTKQAEGKHHIGDFLPPEELKKFMEKYSAVKSGKEPDLSDYKEYKLKEDNVGFKMLQKLGWSEGEGLGAEGTGIVEPINKAKQPVANLGLGAASADGVCPDDDEFDAYRKRMMLAYRFRPNPLNNPRRPYY